MTITLTVAGRIATVEADGHVVAGNTYPVTLSLDSEWTGDLFMRVRFGSLYYDIPFASTAASVDVQMPVGYPEVGIGVFSEALEICTCEARVRLLRSILEAGEQVVEFDSDLYDQWAGEVSELLCDSDFDAESDRPVKNSVLTAWKDTVPLDSALVHRTGDETVAGIKTFTSNIFCKKASPSLTLKSEYPSTSLNTYKGVLGITDLKDGAESTIILAIEQTKSDCEELMVRHYKPDRSGYHTLYLRAYQDHHYAFGVPYYPVDGSGNAQAMPTNVVMLSGNIAVDPRLVHTTGNETVAGNKTFTATMNVKGTAQLVPRTVYDAGTPSTYYGWKGRISIIDHKDGADSVVGDILCTSTQTYGEVSMRAYKPDRSAFSELRLRDYADFQSLLIPSHYPTSSGNPTAPAEGEAMSSGMIAVDPRIVHTTGNESIAGNKTLTGTTTFNGNVAVKGTFLLLSAFIAGQTGWMRLYEVIPHNNSGVIRFTVNPAVTMTHPSEIAVYVAGSASSMSMTAYNNEFGVELIAVRRASDKHIEIWGRKTWSSWQCVFRYRHNVVVGDLTESATAPAVGDTYDMIATL